MPVGLSAQLGKRLFPWSKRHIEDFANPNSSMGEFLAQLAIQDYVFEKWDFLNDTINLDDWTTGETGTGTPFAIPATPLVGGAITGVTGTTSGNCETIYGPPVYAGDYGCIFLVRCKVDVVSTLSMEVGWIDSLTNLALTAVSDIDTPAKATGLGDGAVLHIDTSQTLTTMAFFTEGSTASMVESALTLSPVFTPTAATYHTYVVGIIGDVAFATVDGNFRGCDGKGATIATRVEGGVLVRPWVAVRTRTTAAKTMDIDLMATFQGRDALTT